ncbi:MAG: hypothetical protein WBV89_05315, partial [Ilumatobacter sp.]
MSNTVIDGGASEVPTVVLFPPPARRQKWSPVDLVRLLFGLVFVAVGLFAAAFADGTISGIENDIVDGVGRIPDSVEQAVLGTAQIMATFVPLFVVVVVLWRRRWRLLLMLWLGSVAASTVVALLIAWMGDRAVVATLAARTAGGATLVGADFPTTEFVASAVAA